MNNTDKSSNGMMDVSVALVGETVGNNSQEKFLNSMTSATQDLGERFPEIQAITFCGAKFLSYNRYIIWYLIID